MEELLWTLAKRSQSIQNFRHDIRSVWNDEASKEINLRYLNPHEEDNHDMIKFLEQQQRQLLQAQSKLSQAHRHALEAEAYAQSVQNYLQLADAEAQSACRYRETALDAYQASQAKLPKIEQLLYQANHACG